MRPGSGRSSRTAGGGRSFPPVAGSFRMVAVIRVMLVASSNRTRENGQRSKSRVLPPRASRNPPTRRKRTGVWCGFDTSDNDVAVESEQETHKMVRTASGHTRTALTLEFQ